MWADTALKRLADWDSRCSLGLDGGAEIILEQCTIILVSKLGPPDPAETKLITTRNQMFAMRNSDSDFVMSRLELPIKTRHFPAAFFISPLYMFARKSHIGGEKG